MTRALALAVVAALVAPALVLVDVASADAAVVSRSRLPYQHGTGYAAVAAVAGKAYVFGGVNTPAVDVHEFDATTGVVVTKAAKLPSARWAATAASDGTSVFVFGGGTTTGEHAQILRYDPVGDAMTVKAAQLPTPRSGAAAVYVAPYVYVIGGSSGGTQIVRYDPVADAATVMSAALPEALKYPAVAHDGRYVWILGGRAGSSTATDGIHRYDPVTDTLTTLSTRLPVRRDEAVALWSGQQVYLFGNSWSFGDVIVSFDPAASTVQTLTLKMDKQRRAMGGVWIGSDGWLVGGVGCEGFSCSYKSDIIRFNTGLPDRPVSASTSRGPGGGEITVSWTPPAHADAVTGYRVYAADSNAHIADMTLVGEVGASARTFTETGLANGVTRWYRVASVNAVGEGGATVAVSGVAPVPPDPPTAVAAAAGAGAGEIRVTWQAPAANGGTAVTGYRVWRASAPGQEMPLATVAGTSFTDAGLPNGALRFYRVAAVNGAGEGALSVEVSGATRVAPAAPAWLSASTGAGAGEIALQWGAPSSTGGLPVTGYRVYRGASSGDAALLATVGGTSFTDTGLPATVTRWYRVSAVTSAGEGPMSAENFAWTRGPPVAPAAPVPISGPGAGEIRVTWSEPVGTTALPVTGYRVYGSDRPGQETLVAVTPEREFIETGLPAGATRHYRVAAVNAAGEGALSPSASGTAPVPPSAPRSFQVQQLGGFGPPQLTWQAPSSNGGTAVTGYVIHRGHVGGATQPLTVVATTSWTDNTCPLAKTCVYRVAAVSAAGEGALTGEVVGRGFALVARTMVHSDGSVTAYNDANQNGAVDEEEEYYRTPGTPVGA